MTRYTKGVLAEHETALQKLKRAHVRVQSEKKKEIAGWDAPRLASEMQVYEMLIDQAIHTDPGSSDFRKNVDDHLEKIYSEAQQSGDKYKQRTADEVLKSALSKAKGMDQETRLHVNRIAQQSKQDMEKIRSTPELEAAYEQAETAWGEYRTVRQEVIRTSQAIGEGDPLHPLMTGPFSDAIKRVQVIDNEIKIFEPDDP